MIEERFFRVRIKVDAWTVVQVSAGDSEQACERAMVRAPALGIAWEVKRTKAEILNVSRVEGGLSADDEIDH